MFRVMKSLQPLHCPDGQVHLRGISHFIQDEQPFVEGSHGLFHFGILLKILAQYDAKSFKKVCFINQGAKLYQRVSSGASEVAGMDLNGDHELVSLPFQFVQVLDCAF